MRFDPVPVFWAGRFANIKLRSGIKIGTDQALYMRGNGLFLD